MSRPQAESPERALGLPILSARGVRKSFTIGNRTLEILHGVDMDLQRGEMLALTGTSGAGKSTLLHILGLLDRPSEGTVTIDGTSAWDLSLAERALIRNQRIGFVFQFYHLLPELDAVENVMLPSMIRESRSTFQRRRREHVEHARELLASFGLADRSEHRPGQLSGGERQRVALARALFHDPAILIADEPTGNLDSATGEKVLELIFREQQRRQLSLLLVTHDQRLASRCARQLVMDDGMIAPEGARAPGGSGRDAARARSYPVAVPAAFPLFPVATHKFIVLTIFTLGLYQFYWSFQNWKRLKQASGESLSPFWRAFFAPLWGFSLFPRIRTLAKSNGLAVWWSGAALATLYFGIPWVMRYAESWWWIGYVAALALVVPVQETARSVNDFHAGSIAENRNRNYSIANYAAIVIGGAVIALAAVGALGPE